MRFLIENLSKLSRSFYASSGAIEKDLIQNQRVSRDSEAVYQGLRSAPHQKLIALTLSATVLTNALQTLADAARQSASHVQRLSERGHASKSIGTNVFIGHGRSPIWRELKDLIEKRLGLPVDEFNSVPVAGITTTDRLSALLEAAAFAFLIMTAEDEQTDGKIRARENVVHEVGLFQGRIGFNRAIVLIEEGCEEFSNIQGLGQIRFPKGNISAKFEEIRAVLQREKLI
jgi:predicted nucleotide-binding protein